MSQVKFGNRKVYCNGKIYLGNQKIQALIAFLLMLTLPNLPLVYGLESFQQSSHFWLLAGSVLFLEGLSILFFLALVSSDPGIYVKPLNELENDDTESELKVVEYDHKMFALKFCTICRLHQPLRTYHCRVCGVCVEELDHHCPWVANCIGKRNRRLFLWWLIVMLAMAGEILALIAINLRNTLHDYTIANLRKHIIEIGVFLSLSVMSIIVLVLLLIQLSLIGRGLTTYESLKKFYKTVDNPFNRGCCQNYYIFFTRNTNQQNADIDYYKQAQRMRRVGHSILITNKTQETRESQ